MIPVPVVKPARRILWRVARGVDVSFVLCTGDRVRHDVKGRQVHRVVVLASWVRLPFVLLPHTLRIRAFVLYAALQTLCPATVTTTMVTTMTTTTNTRKKTTVVARRRGGKRGKTHRHKAEAPSCSCWHAHTITHRQTWRRRLRAATAWRWHDTRLWQIVPHSREASERFLVCHRLHRVHEGSECGGSGRLVVAINAANALGLDWNRDCVDHIRSGDRTMCAELIGHFQPCMTEIYLHIDARMADYVRTHP